MVTHVPSRRLQRFLSLADFEPAAKRRLPRPIFGYVAGATEDNASLDDNRAAFAELGFVPRVLNDVSQRQQTIALFGVHYQAPFGVAPMGISALSAYRGDLVQAKGAQARGVPMIMSGASLIRVEEVIDAAPGTWFQAYMPKTLAEIDVFVARLDAAKVSTLVVTVDSAVVPNRENNVRNGFRTPLRPNLALLRDGVSHPGWAIASFLRTLLQHGMPYFENAGAERGAPLLSRQANRDFSGREHLDWHALERIRQQWKAPLVLKGVMHPADALKAKAMGVDGVIVSNHGGRQLDGTVSPMRMLPSIVDACGDYTVMVDSGIRRGTDVLKAIAMGAKCAFVGRPMNYAATVAGQEGVEHAIALLMAEIRADMGILGVTAINQLGREFLRLKRFEVTDFQTTQ